MDDSIRHHRCVMRTGGEKEKKQWPMNKQGYELDLTSQKLCKKENSSMKHLYCWQEKQHFIIQDSEITFQN